MHKPDVTFEELLNNGDPESLKECRAWLEAEERRIAIENERLVYNQQFFDKKMDILKAGFADLEADRRKLERERIAFDAERRSARTMDSYGMYEDLAGTLFAGVNSYLALKKRYRDLLKIFHPDNMCGDNEMVVIITREYERLKKEIDTGFRSVN